MLMKWYFCCITFQKGKNRWYACVEPKVFDFWNLGFLELDFSIFGFSSILSKRPTPLLYTVCLIKLLNYFSYFVTNYQIPIYIMYRFHCWEGFFFPEFSIFKYFNHIFLANAFITRDLTRLTIFIFVIRN